MIRWDGVKRDFDGWNQDQTLRSSMRHSTVWVYQFAREIGEVREKEYLTRIQYGNADPSGGVDRFWLDGAPRISAMEQVDFLRKLYRNELPFKGRASASGQGYHDRRGRARLDPRQRPDGRRVSNRRSAGGSAGSRRRPGRSSSR